MSSENWIGEKLENRYHVLALLGEGGMGRVYRAHDERLNTSAVIKVPKQAILEQAEFKTRFTREIRSLVDLFHPHICRITDVGSHADSPFFVMQFLGGGSLEDRRPRLQETIGPVSPDSLRDWLPTIAKALDFVHGQGYVHRDVKPDNILFDEHGNVYLSDFGITKVMASSNVRQQDSGATSTGHILGTPRYMAPELIMGEEFDGHVDQYALAVTLYEILTGSHPFEGASHGAVLVRQQTHTPPMLDQLNPMVSLSLSQAVARGMTKLPQERFASCTEFVQFALANPGTGTLELPRADLSSTMLPTENMAPPAQVRPVTVQMPAGGAPSPAFPSGRLDMPPEAAMEPAPPVPSIARASSTPPRTPPPFPGDVTAPARSGRSPKWLLLAKVSSIIGLALLAGLIAYVWSQ